MLFNLWERMPFLFFFSTQRYREDVSSGEDVINLQNISDIVKSFWIPSRNIGNLQQTWTPEIVSTFGLTIREFPSWETVVVKIISDLIVSSDLLKVMGKLCWFTDHLCHLFIEAQMTLVPPVYRETTDTSSACLQRHKWYLAQLLTETYIISHVFHLFTEA